MILQTTQKTSGPANALDPVRILLHDLIDYAGLFPPASLNMPAAIANYQHYAHSDWNWILGRFILPASRLGELEEAFPEPAPQAEKPNSRLSVLLGPDPVADALRINEFNAKSRSATIESVECKISAVEEIVRLSEIIPAGLAAYFEVPLSNSAEHIAAVAACRRRAKIRTGGEASDKFPSSAAIIEFLRQCIAANVPFKATAGLHHPLRSIHRFTYQPDSASGMMHGFLNVFLAAAFLRAGMEPGLAHQLLEEQSAEAFQFNSDAVTWRQNRLSRNELAAARREFALSFGSCSFTEPIDDLRSLQLL
jgi:hypothetical protein